MFLKRLAQKAEAAAEENGDKTVTAEHIKSVSKVELFEGQIIKLYKQDIIPEDRKKLMESYL